MDTDLKHLLDFIQAPTPSGWIDAACRSIPTLLLDHAHCERKAAHTAINFLSKYPERPSLVKVMSPLAREELLHFEKVVRLMKRRNIKLTSLTPSPYGQTLHQYASKRGDLSRLQDELIIGAIIEARSCERFHALVPHLLDTELAAFYQSLVKAEARHFENYLRLAQEIGPCHDRIAKFIEIENQFIHSPSEVFRFHSGIPPAPLHKSTHATSASLQAV